MLPRALIWTRFVGGGGISPILSTRKRPGSCHRLSPGRMLLLLLMSSVKLLRWYRCLAVVLLLLAVSIPRRWRLLPPESEILVPKLISAYIHGWRLWWGLNSLIQIIVAWYRRGCVDCLESSFGRQVFLILGLSTHYL